MVGVFWRGLPYFLVERSAMLLGGQSMAIETGTYLGDSAEVLASFFPNVITIERDEKLAKNASNRFLGKENIKVLLGSSRELLRNAIPELSTPVLFWLDAHYSGGVTAGEDDPCPLLEELSAIASCRDAVNSIVLIDDARALTGSDGWPTIDEVCKQFELGSWCVAAIDDVLICSNRNFVEELLNDPHTVSRLYELEKLAGEWHSLKWVMAPSRAKSLVRGAMTRFKSRAISLIKKAVRRFRRFSN
jgi:hypothetical protein